MGLFTRKDGQSQSMKNSSERVYVLIRVSSPSSTESPVWSLAVARPTRETSIATADTKGTNRQRQSKSKKPFLSLGGHRNLDTESRRGSNLQHPTLDSNTTSTTSEDEIHEFSLEAGNLHISRQQRNQRQEHQPRPNSVLLQVLLPRHPSAASLHRDLSLQLEQILYRLTSTQSHLADIKSDTWIKLALFALQHDRVLPSVDFDVERLMDFARNALTGFEAEILQCSATEADSMGHWHESTSVMGAEFVRLVDYEAHVKENDRLRAIFGHGVDNSKKKLEVADRDGIGRGLGVWRLSRMSNHDRGVTREGDIDPYGGLM